ncbi:Asd/ArgC dimerization domain-containing protein [Pokkaliibacter sp. CJK22405]|uniref:Asd/ArgC dimerization domain-containing protein n=1 Tax=Pokkaliibacter sp. CJK22405 TaxID=3384615 RepID=UPI003984E8D0
MKEKLDIAIVGATGVVGESLLELLESKELSVGKLVLLASDRSLGKVMYFKERSIKIQDVATFDFSSVNVAIFVAAADASETFVPKAISAGCKVIDASSYSRSNANIPLYVENISTEALGQSAHIAVADSSAAIVSQVMTAVQQVTQINRADVLVYQAASGAGREAVEELVKQTVHMMSGKGREDAPRELMPATLGFNVIKTDEAYDQQLASEVVRLTTIDAGSVMVSSAWVPVIYGSGFMLHLDLAEALREEQLSTAINAIADLSWTKEVVTPADQAAGKEQILVQLAQQHPHNAKRIALWCVADNIRKGVAANILSAVSALQG